jgi:hypothetical protein
MREPRRYAIEDSAQDIRMRHKAKLAGFCAAVTMLPVLVLAQTNENPNLAMPTKFAHAQLFAPPQLSLSAVSEKSHPATDPVSVPSPTAAQSGFLVLAMWGGWRIIRGIRALI